MLRDDSVEHMSNEITKLSQNMQTMKEKNMGRASSFDEVKNLLRKHEVKISRKKQIV
jgi:hypothetical protein